MHFEQAYIKFLNNFVSDLKQIYIMWWDNSLSTDFSSKET